MQSYEASIQAYRAQLAATLGWPLSEAEADTVPRAHIEPVAEDSLGSIQRLWIDTIGNVRTYGLLFLPRGRKRHPLVICQHGGDGTPELCSNFFGSANYNNMVRRILCKGYAVFAPQLLLWKDDHFGPPTRKDVIDRRLKQLGGSLAALELMRIRRSITYLQSRGDIDARRIGMAGLSYGGFYTLFAAALDTRIRVAVCSGYFDSMFKANHHDWQWFDALAHFTDTEVACMVCPRPLYIEVGEDDPRYSNKHFARAFRPLIKMYNALGLLSDRLVGMAHIDGHAMDQGDGWVNFICRHL